MMSFPPSFINKLLRPLQWMSRKKKGLDPHSYYEKLYWEHINECMLDHPDHLSQKEAQRFFAHWIDLKVFGKGPLIDGLPWLPFPAIEFIKSILVPNKSKVFEFGAGGSTLFFVKNAALVVSVEHSPAWFTDLSHVMEIKYPRLSRKWHGMLIPPTKLETPSIQEPNEPYSYISSDIDFSGLSFQQYVTAIEFYPDQYFDVILIDGRARPSCFLHAKKKVKYGGYIILDNAEREDYSWVEDSAKNEGFTMQEFWGPGPYNFYCWRTIALCRNLV